MNVGKTCRLAGWLAWATAACLMENGRMEARVPGIKMADAAARDVHSLSNPQEVRVTHFDLDLAVDFESRRLQGWAELQFRRESDRNADTLILDTRNLNIERVELKAGSEWKSAAHRMGPTDPILGTPLSIDLSPDAVSVRIHYRTSPMATALQWLAPEQTAGKKRPFLFTQSQAIHARSWIPLQDSPGVRVTYSAVIRCPRDLMAVMSAAGNRQSAAEGEYRFQMPQPIPSYLVALAVGDLQFKEISPRTGVYAEPSVLPAAAAEFRDLESMVRATEALYGPYRWDRYDVLVLPPSFPFGGMENPRLTFATPTILAGDRSLVSLIAHELAHSWSGNLVTNATWRDFWLNEGFTVFIERRIIERLYGRERAESEAALGRRELEDEMARLEAKARVLHIDLAGQDPDDGVTNVPYEKGYLFLRQIESVVGREKFDRFLLGYFDRFAFQSITTAQFVEHLKKELLSDAGAAAKTIPLEEWLTGSDLPPGAPRAVSHSFADVERQYQRWRRGDCKPSELDTSGWSPREWLHFLSLLSGQIEPERLKALDNAFGFTSTQNAEIACQWLIIAIRNHYGAADARLEEFLVGIGRRKFVKPLFEELVKTAEGKRKALSIYRKARPQYHPITQGTVDGIVGWKPEA